MQFEYISRRTQIEQKLKTINQTTNDFDWKNTTGENRFINSFHMIPAMIFRNLKSDLASIFLNNNENSRKRTL